MYNATNAATWLRSPPRIALRRAAIQRNDLFVNLSSHLRAPPLNATWYSATQLNDLFVNLSSHLDDAQRIAANCDLALLISTQRNDLFITPRRNVAYSIAALFYSTQQFVCYFASRHGVTLRGLARRSATQLNDLFVTSRLHATSLNPTPRDSPQRLTLLLHVVLGKATQRTET
tara:strand:- start:500 stop:1021 length:522 start_codon:yes stop_codon:yes gene_type:complete